MPVSLVEALEGIPFPCDRARIVDYARTKGASPHALGRLQTLPDGQFASMTELFTALPSKTGRWRVAPPRSEESQKGQPRARAREKPSHEEEDEEDDIPFVAEPFSPMQLFAPWQKLWIEWMNTGFEYFRRIWLRR